MNNENIAKTCCSIEWSAAEKSVEIRACARGLVVMCSEGASRDAAGYVNVCGVGMLVPEELPPKRGVAVFEHVAPRDVPALRQGP